MPETSLPESPPAELDDPAAPEAAERAQAVQQAEDAAAAQTDTDAATEDAGGDGAMGPDSAVKGDAAEPAGTKDDGGNVPASDKQATAGEDKAVEAEAAKPAKRRRAPKLDQVLAADVDVARQAVLEVAPAEQVGEHAGVRAEDDRVVTHLFESKLAGYEGWQWFAVLARVPRGKVATVSEVGLLPSERSLLAPEWVPWAKRVRPEEQEKADADQAEADANSKQESEPAQK